MTPEQLDSVLIAGLIVVLAVAWACLLWLVVTSPTFGLLRASGGSRGAKARPSRPSATKGTKEAFAGRPGDWRWPWWTPSPTRPYDWRWDGDQ